MEEDYEWCIYYSAIGCIAILIHLIVVLGYYIADALWGIVGNIGISLLYADTILYFVGMLFCVTEIILLFVNHFVHIFF